MNEYLEIFCSETIPPEIRFEDVRIIKNGCVYVVVASTEIKRASVVCGHTNGISLAFYEGNIEKEILLDITLRNVEDLTAFLWEYRYGPTIVFVPCFSIMSSDKDLWRPLTVVNVTPFSRLIQETLDDRKKSLRKRKTAK